MLNALVLAWLPRTGLANRLLVWAKAISFADDQGYRVIPVGWAKTNIGPWLRGEREKRIYWSAFRRSLGVGDAAKMTFDYIRRSIVLNPNSTIRSTGTILFNQIPIGPRFFEGVTCSPQRFRDEITRLLSPKIKETIVKSEVSDIALHIRRGDFIAQDDARFSLGGPYCQLPIAYYRDAIQTIRSLRPELHSVMIFSDGHDFELQSLLEIPGVRRAPLQDAIVDLMLLSRSRVIVTSPWSTFSYVAGFLSSADVIRFEYPEMQPLPRPPVPSEFEGSIEAYAASMVGQLTHRP